jgi:hypothetical protein
VRTPKAIKDQPGYRSGAQLRVAKSATGGYRLYVRVSDQWMDGSLQDDPKLEKWAGYTNA